LGVPGAGVAGGGLLSSVVEVFEFERTASRLIEMQSRDWLEDWAERHKAKATAEVQQAQA